MLQVRSIYYNPTAMKLCGIIVGIKNQSILMKENRNLGIVLTDVAQIAL